MKRLQEFYVNESLKLDRIMRANAFSLFPKLNDPALGHSYLSHLTYNME